MTRIVPKKELLKWLKDVIQQPFTITPLAGDASKRFYFRVETKEKQVIAVDASLEKQMNHAFATLATTFRAHGINVPDIFAADLKQGYSLITDFGDHLYESVLRNDNATSLYNDALTSLLKFQTFSLQSLPPYSFRLLVDEVLLFRDWYLERHLKSSLSLTDNRLFEEVATLLAKGALEQPQVPVHRDYHSRNLFWLPTNNPGIVDFQDAVFGPLTYDAVSLLRDCYIDWPLEQVHTWLSHFFDAFVELHRLSCGFEQFVRWFDWMGLQRHLKAVGIFARLFERDGLATHLPSIPRTLGYIKQVAEKYPEFKTFKDFF